VTDLAGAIERLVDERVRLAPADHHCGCSRRDGAPPTRSPEIAESLGLSTRQVYRLAESGELPTKRIGGKLLVLVDAFREFLAAV
jgi:excisionase family DNA binding protein